ncbi:RNA-binding domain-containing protein, partial [Wilcoxina mikolae CBS 423.85]
KKRKRTSPSDGDLEIDVSAPEPPSKKALRKLKKHPELAPKILKPTTTSTTSTPTSEFPEHSSQARSKFGIWIGNLSFSTTPVILTDFLAGENKDSITRINLPLQNGRNKGFAYVDFKTESALQHALSLSESLLGGRRVLIKNAKDFSNRPSVATAESTSTAPRVGANLTSKPPSRILYVGNLEFSCTAEHLKSHFSFAGNIQKVRLATFEDTERCKGFGFVNFEDKESVKRAMLGLTPEEELVYEDLEGKEEVALHSLRKKRGILNGRPITMEYGEDPSVRYKKRFG